MVAPVADAGVFARATADIEKRRARPFSWFSMRVRVEVMRGRWRRAFEGWRSLRNRSQGLLESAPKRGDRATAHIENIKKSVVAVAGEATRLPKQNCAA